MRFLVDAQLPPGLARYISSKGHDAEYLDVREEDGRIVLVPMHPDRADEVRAKLEKIGVTKKDVEESIK